MNEPTIEDQLAYWRRRHVWNMHAGIEECVTCGEGWPCDASSLLGLIGVYKPVYEAMVEAGLRSPAVLAAFEVGEPAPDTEVRQK